MKIATAVLAITLSFFVSPVLADPQADAKYIISQTMTRSMFEGAIAAQRPLILGAIQNDLNGKNIKLTDPNKFLDLFMEEFLGEFTDAMQEQGAALYLENFSDKELADLAAFFKTDSGKAYLQASPKLMLEGARMGQLAGQKAGLNAGKRLAKRIESENLIVVDDPSNLSELLEAIK
ncbi:hypothetical protein MXMO3_01294 [Maritalea myrionectae]|uniref:DUF2059 domain-containing protein n=1 Tax=Maritalea myrionectae TaxID=454601 RepID=A0A2R4MD17_9HYPH|nr:DUF2059 domain-containing protein [Maritalea myrionectae]AVX03825.1 hypothetical protein MXMO3_01294 [Maritalea myrionectae]